MTTNALSIYNQFDQLERAALALQKSGYFKDVTSQAQAIVKVMAGAELGLPPFASMSGIHIIQGKPVLGANVLATLVKNSGRYDYSVKVCDNKDCEIAWFENGKQTGSSRFTWDEAKVAGLTGKDNWTKYPSDMLFARAISRGARRFAPGIFGGAPVYTADEMGAEVDQDGFIDTQAFIVTAPDTAPLTASATGKDEPAPDDTGLMDYQQACDVLNSDGVKYGTLESDKLSMMTIGIAKGLKNANNSQQLLDELMFKRDAIKSILAHRAATQGE